MVQINNFNYLMKEISHIKGVGKKTLNILNKKKIFNILDLLWKLPYSYEDRTKISKINELQIGKIHTVKIEVLKYNFPRKRNLPNKVICSDNTGKIECIFFNSFEGYIRKILPLKNIVTISGKISFYKNTYQITNPSFVSTNDELILKKHNKYSLTEGITNKSYNKIMNEVLINIPQLEEWHTADICKKFNNIRWRDAILKLHEPTNIEKNNKDFYRRLVFDEIFASMLISSEIRRKIKKVKKDRKIFNELFQKEIIKNIEFNLTEEQQKALFEINNDLKKQQKMFRLLQGDVGTGKTIVALISAINVIQSGYQACVMAPTEILAKQHFNLAKKIYPKNINIFLLTGKTDIKEKKFILNNIKNQSNNIYLERMHYFKIKFHLINLVILS